MLVGHEKHARGSVIELTIFANLQGFNFASLGHVVGFLAWSMLILSIYAKKMNVPQGTNGGKEGVKPRPGVRQSRVEGYINPKPIVVISSFFSVIPILPQHKP